MPASEQADRVASLPSEATAARGEHVGWLCVVLAGSLLLRVSLLGFESGDYRAFLSNWFDYLVQHGRWAGFRGFPDHFQSYCYPPLYLYVLSLSTVLPLPKLYAIKLISVVGDYVAAWYVWRLARREYPGGGRALTAVACILFLPTVVMNGALWGQCDMLYTACLLASLRYVLEKRPVAALVAFGLAFSFKPQAIFWCPFLAGLFVTGRLPGRQIWIPAAIYLAWYVPVIAAGHHGLSVVLHWGSAAVNGSALTLGATNWYQWAPGETPKTLWWIGVVLTLAATAVLVWRMRAGPQGGMKETHWLVALALLSVLFPPFLLPGVHERYFFAADVVSVVFAFYVPRQWLVPALVQFASCFAYLPYLFEREPIPVWLLALAMLEAIGLVSVRLWWCRPTPAPGTKAGVV